MNPAARGANDELVNLALIGLVAAFALALVLRAAATAAAAATGATTPEGGIASGLRVLTDPGRPARAFEAPGLSAVAYWSVVTLFLGVLATVAWCIWRLVARLRHRTARDPHRIQGHRNRAGHRHDRIEEGPRTTRRHPPPLDPAPEGERRRLPDRAQLRPRDLGIGRGLDPRDRSATFRQGTAPRHQCHPRRAWRRRHHLHPAGQHRRHDRRPEGPRAGCRLRPAAPHCGADRSRRLRRPMVADPRLRAAAHRDDPRGGPRVIDRALIRRHRVRRLLGRQGPLRDPGTAPCSRARAAPDSSPLRVVAVRLGSNRRRRHPRQPPPAPPPVGRTPSTA